MPPSDPPASCQLLANHRFSHIIKLSWRQCMTNDHRLSWHHNITSDHMEPMIMMIEKVWCLISSYLVSFNIYVIYWWSYNSQYMPPCCRWLRKIVGIKWWWCVLLSRYVTKLWSTIWVATGSYSSWWSCCCWSREAQSCCLCAMEGLTSIIFFVKLVSGSLK